MPITVHDQEADLYGDADHWEHVMNHLFIPAIEAAGYEPIVPAASGTSMIHGRIIKHLVDSDMVICDLSRHNPNVMFELGVRTSLNKPVALVKDEYLDLPFDIQGLNTYAYSCKLSPWSIGDQVTALTSHLKATVVASGIHNPLWGHFGVSISASQPPKPASPEDAKLQLILEKVENLAKPFQPVASRPRPSRSEWGNYEILDAIAAAPGVNQVSLTEVEDGTVRLEISTVVSSSGSQFKRAQDVITRIAVAGGGKATIEHTSSEEISLRLRSVNGPQLMPTQSAD